MLTRGQVEEMRSRARATCGTRGIRVIERLIDELERAQALLDLARPHCYRDKALLDSIDAFFRRE